MSQHYVACDGLSDAPHAPLLPQEPSVGREDSLAELESSFMKQVMSGEIAADPIEEEPGAPSQSLGREDSLAQLESSFKKQVKCAGCQFVDRVRRCRVYAVVPESFTCVGIADVIFSCIRLSSHTGFVRKYSGSDCGGA